jgi:hypothetical protein
MEIKDGGILIIAAPRVGGTNLMKSLGSYYNKKTCMEHDLIRNYPYFDSNKDVLKYVPLWESNYDKILDTEIYKDILNKAKEFKTIILLDRKNKKEQLESYYVLERYNKGNVSVKWRDEEIDKTDTKYKQWKSYINSFTELFKMISKDLKLPIDFYEDIYKKKSLTNKNIKLDLEYFKPKYKLRQPIIEKKLL